MWLPLVTLIVTTLCVAVVSGNTVWQPMDVDVRQGNVIRMEIGPEKKSTGESPAMGSNLPVQGRTKPKGIGSRITADLRKKLLALDDVVHSGSGKMRRLAHQMLSVVKSNLNRDGSDKMVEDIPDMADHPGPQKKLQGHGENIKQNMLNHVFKDTTGRNIYT